MSDKAKRGTKRVCSSCSAKYYDLNRDPIVCPLCEAVFEVKKPEPKPKKAEPKPVKPEPEKAEATEAADAILDGEDELIDIDDADEVQPTEDDDTFLEVEEEPEAAVSAIVPVPGVSKDEES